MAKSGEENHPSGRSEDHSALGSPAKKRKGATDPPSRSVAVPTENAANGVSLANVRVEEVANPLLAEGVELAKLKAAFDVFFDTMKKIALRRFLGKDLTTISDRDQLDVLDLVKSLGGKKPTGELETWDTAQVFVGKTCDAAASIVKCLPKDTENLLRKQLSACGFDELKLPIGSYTNLSMKSYTGSFQLSAQTNQNEEDGNGNKDVSEEPDLATASDSAKGKKKKVKKKKKTSSEDSEDDDKLKESKSGSRDALENLLEETKTLPGVKLTFANKDFKGEPARDYKLWLNLLKYAEVLLLGQEIAEDRLARGFDINDALVPNRNSNFTFDLNCFLKWYCDDIKTLEYKKIECSFVRVMCGCEMRDVPHKTYLVVGELRSREREQENAVFLFHPPTGSIFPTNNEGSAYVFGKCFRGHCDTLRSSFTELELRNLRGPKNKDKSDLAQHPATRGLYNQLCTHVLNPKKPEEKEKPEDKDKKGSKKNRNGFTYPFSIQDWYYLYPKVEKGNLDEEVDENK